MRSGGRKFDLAIQITLALTALGRPYKGVTKGLTIAQMEAMLATLKREQAARGKPEIIFMRVK